MYDTWSEVDTIRTASMTNQYMCVQIPGSECFCALDFCEPYYIYTVNAIV